MTRSWGYPPQKRPDPGRYAPQRYVAGKRGFVPEPARPLLSNFEMGTSAMRETEATFRVVQKPLLTRAARLAVIVLGVGLVMAAGPVRAGDDEEEDDRTFEEKIIGNIMAGIGATNMEDKGIEYRERSPLVVPHNLDLPPPAAASTDVKAPNWPTEPDDARQKAAIA